MARLHLDLVDPIAHPGGDLLARGFGLPNEGLSQQADIRQGRPQLVRQVVHELAPDPLQPAQLGDVLQGQPGDLAVRRSASPDDERQSLGRAQGQLTRGDA